MNRPAHLYADYRIKFTNEKLSYKVQAVSRRYAICTKPMNALHTVLYTIIDWDNNIRGTENTIFGLGAETREQCLEMMIRLLDGESEVSSRNWARLNIEWIKGISGKTVEQEEAEIAAVLKK